MLRVWAQIFAEGADLVPMSMAEGGGGGGGGVKYYHDNDGGEGVNILE